MYLNCQCKNWKLSELRNTKKGAKKGWWGNSKWRLPVSQNWDSFLKCKISAKQELKVIRLYIVYLTISNIVLSKCRT